MPLPPSAVSLCKQVLPRRRPITQTHSQFHASSVPMERSRKRPDRAFWRAPKSATRDSGLGAKILVSLLEWPRQEGARAADSGREERAAMKAAAAERKASQKQEDLDKALAEAIAKLPDDERKMAEQISTRSCASTRRCSHRRRTTACLRWRATARSTSSCSLQASSRCATARLASIPSRTWTTATCGRPRSPILKIEPAEEKKIIALGRRTDS